MTAEGPPQGAPDLVALAREGIESWNNDGLEAFAQRWWAPEVVWEEAPDFPEAGLHRGREACVKRMLERFEAVGHVELTTGEARQLSDRRVFFEVIVRGRGSASGVPIEMREWFISEMEQDGRAVFMREFLDREEALAAAARLG